MIVSGAHPYLVAQWMVDRVKWLRVPALFTVVALWDGGRIRAAVMYENLVDDSICCHIAVEHLTPAFMGEIFRYPFEQLGVRRIAVRVAADNLKSRSFVKKLGFRFEGRAREALPGPLDVLAFSMLRRECRWLGVRAHGNQQHAGGRGDPARSPEHAHAGAAAA